MRGIIFYENFTNEGKNMKFKKLPALILGGTICFLLAFGVAACGDSNSDDAGTSDTDTGMQDKTEITNSDYVGKTFKVVESNLKYYYYGKEVTENSTDDDEVEAYEEGVDTIKCYVEGLTLTFDGDGESVTLSFDSAEEMGTATAKYTLVDGQFDFSEISSYMMMTSAEAWFDFCNFTYDGENVIVYVAYRESAETDSEGNVTNVTVIAYAQGAMEEITF